MVNAPTLDPSYAAPLVSFSLDQSSSESTSRLGTLTLTPREDTPTVLQTIKTPSLIANAPRGAVTHLTPDNLRRCDSTAVHLSLEHFLDIQPPPFSKAPFALDHFIGLSPSQSHRTHATNPETGKRAPSKEGSRNEERVLISMSLREPNLRDETESDKTKGVPTNGDNEAVAIGGRGVVKVSPKIYLDWTLPRPPDLLFALADEPSESKPSKKRLEKSIRRSLVWLEEIARGASERTNVFATLVGSDDAARRTEFSSALTGISSSRATATASTSSPIEPHLSGYVLQCSDSPSPSLLHASLSPLPRTKPRIGLSPQGPHEILRLVRDVGIDLFVEEWSQRCSTYGVALDFQFPIAFATTTTESSSQSEIGINLYEPSHAYSFTPLSTSNLSPKGGEQGGDHPFGPSIPTRSYVHHLLLAHEMTSHVILALHNQVHMTNFLKSIREVLGRLNGEEVFRKEVEKFEEKYKDRKDHGGEYECFLEGKKCWEVVEKARGKGSMKDKVLELEKEEETKEEIEKVLVGAVVEEGINTK
ncbi:hypothetical protein JCM16303_003918 [Sporobolomyces ruberrimus]